MPRTPSIWQAVVEAHEREVMMQREARMPKPGSGMFVPGPGDGSIPGRPVGVTPAELMARQLRLAQAIAQDAEALRRIAGNDRGELEDAIRAYAKKLIAQRAEVVKDARLWDQARALLVRAGAEPPR